MERRLLQRRLRKALACLLLVLIPIALLSLAVAFLAIPDLLFLGFIEKLVLLILIVLLFGKRLPEIIGRWLGGLAVPRLPPGP